MTELIDIHPDDPQPRLVARVARILQAGGVVVLPTDGGYSLFCALGQKEAVERIRRIRELDKRHFFTLFCANFAEVAEYAKVNNQVFRFIKAHSPGPVTFILVATRIVPKRLLHPRRRTIGIRIPSNCIVRAVMEQLEQPLMSVSVEESREERPPRDAEAIYEELGTQLDAVVNGRIGGVDHITIINLTSGLPEVIRQGSYAI